MAGTANPRSTAQFSSFKEAYDTLRKTAEELRSEDEPDIDHLATKVLRSVEAYKECESRISAVEKALEGVFAREGAKASTDTDDSGEAPEKPQSRRRAESKPGGKFDDFEDDIPF